MRRGLRRSQRLKRMRPARPSYPSGEKAGTKNPQNSLSFPQWEKAQNEMR